MNLGELYVTLGAVLDRFNRNVQEAQNRLTALSASMRQVVSRAAVVGAAATAAGAAIVAGLVRSGLQAIDTNAKLARILNGTIDGLRALQIAAGDAGVEQSELSRALEILNARLGEAQRTGSPAAKMLEDLGLNAAELGRLDVDERVAAMADRVKALGLSAQQTSDFARQLGIRSAEFVEVLRNGGDAIRAARVEVDEFGLSVSAVDAAQVEAANDALERIGRSLEAVKNQLAIALAPILQEVADRFNALVREQGGFREATADAAERGIRAFAKVADVVQGLRVVLKGAELVGRGFGAALVSVAQLGAEAWVAYTDTVIRGVNTVIDQLNRIPGVEIARQDLFTDSPFMQGFRSMAGEMRDAVGETRAELHELAMQEMPSAKAEEFLAAVRDRAKEAAEAAVQAQNALAGAPGLAGFGADDGEGDKDAERAQERASRLREQQEMRLQMLREFVMSEAELEAEQHAQRMEQLREFFDEELITAEEFQALRESLEQEHFDRLREIRERSMSELEKFTSASFGKQVQTVTSALVQMTAGVATHSKKMFALNKAAAIANAIVNAYEGISRTLKEYPYPLNVAMAAAHAAAAFAQVSAIKSQQFGGTGGAAPSLAGGTPAPPVTPVGGAGGGGTVITLQGIDAGSLYSGKQVRALIEAIQGELDDGARLVIN